MSIGSQAQVDMEQQGRLLAGIFRQNPGGVNVVTDLTSDAAVMAAQDRLGVKLAVAKIPKVDPNETITAAAMEFNGRVFQGIDHGEATIAARAGGAVSQGKHRVGFMTSSGRFVEDAEALAIAKRTGQLPKNFLEANMSSQAFVANDPNFGAGAISSEVIPSQGKFDLLIGRPTYEYPSFEDQTIFGRLTNKVTNILKKMATEAATSVRAPRTTEAFILADGEPIRGGLNTSALVEKMRLQKPVVGGVERGDIGLREAGKFVRLELTDEKSLVIDLPRTLSREQFTSIGKAIDTMKFEQVTLNAGEKSLTVRTPIGAIVQDRIAELVPPKSIGSSITPEMVQQYKRSGVFAGQAAVLPDGTAAEILHKRGAAGYRVRETLTGAEFNIGAKNLTILPTALKGELQGSNLFASYMSDVERAALAKLRKAQLEGWAEPIRKYRDFESYANTRGYMAEQLRGGKVRLSKVNEGGQAPITFKDIPSAIEWVRKDTAPMAELANEEVTKLLGPDRNMGWIGGGGPPPRFNEIMPIDWKRMEATMETLPSDRGPGFF